MESIREAIRLLHDHWKLPPRDQLALLGLKESEQGMLSRIREGKAISDPPGFRDRVDMFLKIDRALRIITRGNKKIAHAWIRNRNAFFDNYTPLEVIRNDGMAGLIRVTESISRVAGIARQSAMEMGSASGIDHPAPF